MRQRRFVSTQPFRIRHVWRNIYCENSSSLSNGNNISSMVYQIVWLYVLFLSVLSHIGIMQLYSLRKTWIDRSCRGSKHRNMDAIRSHQRSLFETSSELCPNAIHKSGSADTPIVVPCRCWKGNVQKWLAMLRRREFNYNGERQGQPYIVQGHFSRDGRANVPKGKIQSNSWHACIREFWHGSMQWCRS